MRNSPKTLLQIAGASLYPSQLQNSAVVPINPQLEYVTGALPLNGINAAVKEASLLLDLARTKRVPIFHVVHHGRPGAAAFDPHGPYVANIPELAPRAGEAIITKSLPNSFSCTELHRLIGETGRSELIIAGFATHMCVSTTTRAALDLGYRCTVVAKATATRDLQHPCKAGVIPAAVVHESNLAALADRFAIIVPDATTSVLNGQPSA